MSVFSQGRHPSVAFLPVHSILGVEALGEENAALQPKQINLFISPKSDENEISLYHYYIQVTMISELISKDQIA